MNSIYEIVEVKWINYPKKNRVNLSKENAILKLTNGKSIKFYRQYLIIGLTNVTVGTKFHLIYSEDSCKSKYGKQYEVDKAISLTDKSLIEFINKYNPSKFIIKNYILHGLKITNYLEYQEYDNWLCDNIFNIPRNNDERISNLLYSMINSDPLKKFYSGYSFIEVKNYFYNKIFNSIGEDFDIEKAWNYLINLEYGKQTMCKTENKGYYFPEEWTY